MTKRRPSNSWTVNQRRGLYLLVHAYTCTWPEVALVFNAYFAGELPTREGLTISALRSQWNEMRADLCKVKGKKTIPSWYYYPSSDLVSPTSIEAIAESLRIKIIRAATTIQLDQPISWAPPPLSHHCRHESIGRSHKRKRAETNFLSDVEKSALTTFPKIINGVPSTPKGPKTDIGLPSPLSTRRQRPKILNLSTDTSHEYQVDASNLNQSPAHHSPFYGKGDWYDKPSRLQSELPRIAFRA